MSTSRTAVGLIVSAGLLVGGGLAAGTLAASGALAASPTPTPSATASSAVPGAPDGDGHRRGGHGPGMGVGGPRDGLGQGRMLHGELVVEKAGGGTETLLVQHGTVTAKSSDSVTVKSSDGFTVTWKVTSDTTVRAGRPPAGAAASTLADVATGTDVVVSGPKTSTGGTARMLGVRPAGKDAADGGTKPAAPSATTSPAVLNG